MFETYDRLLFKLKNNIISIRYDIEVNNVNIIICKDKIKRLYESENCPNHNLYFQI